MSVYTKKIRSKKGASAIDAKLYTDPNDIGGKTVSIKSGGDITYSKLVPVDDPLATSVKVKKGSDVYAIASAVGEPVDGFTVDSPGIIINSRGVYAVANGSLIDAPVNPKGDPTDPIGIVIKDKIYRVNGSYTKI